MENQNSQNRGIEPLLAEAPSVKVGEKTYPLRRLGIRDVWTFARILRNAGTSGLTSVIDLVKQQKMDQRQAGMFAILLGLVDQEEELMKWLANIMRIDVESLSNPDQFPLGSLIDIIQALSDHPDMADFFTRLETLMKNPRMMDKISRLSGNEQPTGFNTDTPGSQTNNF